MQKIEAIDKKKDSLMKGAFSLTLSVIIVKVIGYIYKVPLSHIMGDEGMGYFNSAYTIFAFFYMICSGGVPRAVSIAVTEFDIKGNTAASKRMFILSLRIFLAIGITFSILLMLFSGFFASLIGSNLSAFSIFLVAPSLTFVAASGVIRGYLNGKGKMVSIAIAEVIEGGIKFIFGLLFALAAARLNQPYYMISAFAVLGVTIGSFSSSCFLYIYLKKLKKGYKAEQCSQKTISDLELIKQVVKIALPITLSCAVMGMSNVIDLGMIIKRLVSIGVSEAEAVALYGNFTTLAVPLLNLISALTSPISASALPHLAASYREDKEKFRSLNDGLLTFTACVATPVSFAYLFFSKEILLLLFNDESAIAAYILLSLLSPAVIFMPILTIINTVLESAAFPKLSLFSMLIGAAVKITCGYFLIGKFGIVGAPLSTSLSYAVSMILSALFAKIVCGAGFSPFKVFFAPFLFSAASVGMAKTLYTYISDESDNLVLFLLFAFISAVVYLLFILIFIRKRLKTILEFVKINKKRQKAL